MEELIKFEAAEELDKILAFWRRMEDDTNGGFFSSVDYSLLVDKTADKSGVSAAGSLWMFSNAYRLTEDKHYLRIADHAYAFLARNLIDSVHGGAYWMLDYQGSVVDNRKHIFLQAACIHALSEYYLASGTRRALELAMKIWHIIEETGYDSARNAYREEFSREWEAVDNDLMSDDGMHAEITAETHLNILEAYTVLYRAIPTKPVRTSLQRVMGILAGNIYSTDDRTLKMFFDSDWNELSDLVSFGHDISASRIIDSALKVLMLNDEVFDRIVVDLAGQVLESAFLPDGSLANERFEGELDKARLWWVQAEAVIGFLNAWEKTADEKYYNAFSLCWRYIREKIVDHRSGGEWLCGRDDSDAPMVQDIAGEWKSPLYSGRCCLELLSRFK